MVQVAPFVEQVHAEAGLLDRLEELLGNDGVGIDVFAVHGGDKALVHGELLHGCIGFRVQRAARSMALPALCTSWPMPLTVLQARSEERRVGKECRSRWS